LTIQYALDDAILYPTTVTPWFNYVPHAVPVITPDLYKQKHNLTNMSKITIVIATIAVLGVIASFQFYSTKNQTTIVAADVTDEVLGSLFEHWKLAHGKIYENPELEEKKLKTFMDNYVFVVNWNADKTHTSQVELN